MSLYQIDFTGPGKYLMDFIRLYALDRERKILVGTVTPEYPNEMENWGKIAKAFAGCSCESEDSIDLDRVRDLLEDALQELE